MFVLKTLKQHHINFPITRSTQKYSWYVLLLPQLHGLPGSWHGHIYQTNNSNILKYIKSILNIYQICIRYILNIYKIYLTCHSSRDYVVLGGASTFIKPTNGFTSFPFFRSMPWFFFFLETTCFRFLPWNSLRMFCSLNNLYTGHRLHLVAFA